MRDAGTMGGHFSAFLETRKNTMPGSHGYESARSALYVYLKAARPKRLFTPNYICDAVYQAATAAGIECVRYPINEHFQPAERLCPSANEHVLLVNYFGLCERAIHQALEYLPTEQVIVDCSQAYFFSDGKNTTKIYSPRKFLPVADGGFIDTITSLDARECDNEASIRRYGYLLKRAVAEPELSRPHYLQAEKELESISNRGISDFTKTICETTDFNFIKNRRRVNFQILSELNSANHLTFELAKQVPLCYPILAENGNKIHEFLLQARIFTPRYWPNIKPLNDFEERLLKNTVFLPIDHRYTAEQMHSLLASLQNLYR
jgi:hypothetical protein